MGFLCRVAGVFLRDRVRSSAFRQGLRAEPLLLWVERSWMRWFRHLMRMPLGCFPRVVVLAHPTGRPRGRPRTRFRDYISWPGSAWGFPQSELADVKGLGLAAAPTTRLWISSWQWTDGWMDGWTYRPGIWTTACWVVAFVIHKWQRKPAISSYLCS